MNRIQLADECGRRGGKLRLGCGLAVIALCVVGRTKADFDIDLGRGPVTVHVPASYDPEVPTPLILLLHGYGYSGSWVEDYMQFTPLSEEYGFLYAYPDGTRDRSNRRFWNATDACCDFGDTGVDDSGYLSDLIDAIKAEANVDERRVHLVGHSNGGFMSYRMACDHADTIASIASLAGATYLDPNDCTPAEPVHVLEIHGSADESVNYEGGDLYNGRYYPGAVQTVETWATYNGCSLISEPGDPLDLDAGIPGAETEVTRYTTDCQPGGSAELWTIVDGSHFPLLSDDFGPLVIEFLYTHPKPCAGDLDDDGQTSQSDLGILLSDWGCTSGDCPGDLDADGETGQSDLGILLADWGCGANP